MIKISLGLLLLLLSAPVLAMNFHTSYAQATPIYQKWQELGGSNGFLGEPVGGETPTGDGKGSFQNFRDGDQNFPDGAIYWSPETGAHEVHGSILQKYRQINTIQTLGYPKTDSIYTPPNNYCPCRSEFQGGVIYAEIEPFFMFWPIWDKFVEKKSVIGSPIGDSITRDNQKGFLNQFQSGVIFYTRELGAHEVHGSILQKYMEVGAELGNLGYPRTDEMGTGGGCPCQSNFYAGIIYTSPETNWIPRVTEIDPDRPEINPNCPKCD
jgi:Uncharacterized protein potentially involved in peptidoglycan biosynthesis